MLTIEKEVDLAIDLKSTNASLLSNKDIRAFYADAIGEDSWDGVLAVKGEDFVIASVTDDWFNGTYAASVITSREGYDANDDEIELTTDSFAQLATWQTVSRFIEDGYFIVKYEEGNVTRRFKVGSGRAEQL